MARARLRKEVELEVDKRLLDEQARYLLRTNYVYKTDGVYRSDLVDSLPDGSAVPPCIQACAVFVKVAAEDSDVKEASGPASSIAVGKHEAEMRDAEEMVKWMPVIDEDDADIAEMSAIPSLQQFLERLESQAGRAAANEFLAVPSDGANCAKDELGRNRLAQIGREFQSLCQKFSPEDEPQHLL